MSNKSKFKQTETDDGSTLSFDKLRTPLTTGIPEGWEERELDSLGEIVTGKTPHTIDKDNFGTEYPFITPRDMKDQKYIESTERYLSEKGKDEVNNCIVPGSTICVSCIGSDMGKVVMTTRPSITNQQLNSIVPQDINPDFIYYAVKNISEQMRDVAFHSTAVPILNKSSFSRFKILVPKDNKQRDKITKILSDLDAKIELNHQMNKTLESIAQAIFKKWFVDFEFLGYENTKIINGLPEGWRSSKLGDFAVILNGFAFKSEDFVNFGIFLLRTRNFTEDGYIVRDDTACLPESFYNEYKNFRLKKFDVLLVMVGASVGKMAMVQSSVLPALQNQNMWNFRSKSGSGQLFLNFLVKKIVQENMGTASGSARDFFRKDYFRSINFILPNEKILKDFDKQVTPIFDQIDKNLTESGILSQIRDSLLPKLMSGKMRIN